MTGYIDIVCNPYTPYVVENKMMGVDNEFQDQVRMSDTMRNGVEIEDYIKKMDKAGIERSFLISARAGDLNVKGSR